MTQEFDSLLVQLADESRPIQSIDIFPLSDLAREQLPNFEAAWHALSAPRRLELIGAMVEQAETNIHFCFHTVLRRLLGDPEARVRRLAVEGLWEDEKTNLIPSLVNLLGDDPSVEVRATAAISLGRYVLLGILGDIREKPAMLAQQALLQAWGRPGEVNEVRRRALESLAYGNPSGLNEMIRNAYFDDDAAMRQSAVFSMGRTTDPRWSRYVLDELQSHEPAMRFEAAQAAGEMGLKAAVQLLIRCVDDTDASVRQAAVSALGKIGGPAAKRALQALLEFDDEVLVQAAEDALDELNFGSGAQVDALPGLAPGVTGKDSPDDLDDRDEFDDDWESALEDDGDFEDDFDFEADLEMEDGDFDWDAGDEDEDEDDDAQGEEYDF